MTAGTAALGLAATGAVGLGIFSPATAADVELSKSFDYTCEVTAGGLPLGEHLVGVLSETTVPETVYPGEVIPERGVDITLTMPELLRSSTAGLLGGVGASGASTDSAITLSSAGQTQTIGIPSLAAERTPIPQGEGDPWLIPAKGTVPAITTPDDVVDTVTLGMPASFSIVATVYKADDSTVEANLSCTGPAELALGDIEVVAAPEPEPTEEPTVEPTEEPTVEPTEEPTVEPTVEPTDEPTVEPTEEPTVEPTTEPTVEPTEEPTVEPTTEPTEEPTTEPTEEPTTEPTVEPTTEPTVEPTEEPTTEPTTEPTEEPTNPEPGDVELTGTFDYTCNVTAGGLPLGEHVVGVLAETTVPEFVEPGMVISSRDVGITLTMPELLRNSTVGLLGGVAASGASTDSTITLTTGGQTETVPIPSLAAARTDIPQVVNQPWLIPASGATPEIPVPDHAVDKVDMGMPASFSIVATVYKADDSTVEAALTCVGPANLALGSIPVGRDSVPTDGPTTAPTDGPTTAPTDGPTTAPTDGPTTSPTDDPTGDPTDDPIIDAPSIASPGDVVTFTFATEWIGKSLDFELHSDPIALGTKVVDELGEASVKIPANAPLGDHTIKVLSDGQVIASVPIEIVAADGGDDSDDSDGVDDSGYLASAGGPTLTIAVLGAALVLAGGGVMTLRRRRD